jgi:uncharacterized membrane protein (UPF0127 family)
MPCRPRHSACGTRPLRLLAILLVACGTIAVALPNNVAINGHTWHVELALTPDQQQEGLAHRSSLPRGQGMLFVFDEARKRDFWMKGCEMTIDIAFIGPDRKVLRTYTMPPEPGKTEEQLTLYNSVEPAQYALEVGKGDLAAAGVKRGDVVSFSPGIPLITKAQPSTGR